MVQGQVLSNAMMEVRSVITLVSPSSTDQLRESHTVPSRWHGSLHRKQVVDGVRLLSKATAMKLGSAISSASPKRTHPFQGACPRSSQASVQVQMLDGTTAMKAGLAICSASPKTTDQLREIRITQPRQRGRLRSSKALVQDQMLGGTTAMKAGLATASAHPRITVQIGVSRMVPPPRSGNLFNTTAREVGLAIVWASHLPSSRRDHLVSKGARCQRC